MTIQSHTATHWLIWDGECSFCGDAVSWFRQLDQHEQFTIIPAQNCPNPPMTPKLEQEARRSMIVVTNDGQIILGGRAVLFVLEQVGWHSLLIRTLQKRPLVWTAQAGYRIVANNRQFFSRFLFPGSSGCQVQYRHDDDKGHE